jgi:hypothetical protein
MEVTYPSSPEIGSSGEKKHVFPCFVVTKWACFEGFEHLQE